MPTLDVSLLVASVIDGIVLLVLLFAATATLTGNFAAKRFFDACGLGLRARYGVAVLLGVIALAFAAGYFTRYASTFMIATLLVLATMALLTGSRPKSAAMAATASVLLIAETSA